MITKQIFGPANLQVEDPEIYDAIEQEAKRQHTKLELIASEHYVSHDQPWLYRG